MIGFIGGLFGRMFGSDKAMDTVVNKTASALDKLIYTKQEQAEDAKNAVTEARKMVISWMESTQGQNLARRFIAVMVAMVWLFQYLACMVLSVVAVWVAEPDKFVESAKVIGDYANQMNGAMMLILAFYFAAPHMGEIVSSALSRFSKPRG